MKVSNFGKDTCSLLVGGEEYNNGRFSFTERGGGEQAHYRWNPLMDKIPFPQLDLDRVPYHNLLLFNATLKYKEAL